MRIWNHIFTVLIFVLIVAMYLKLDIKEQNMIKLRHQINLSHDKIYFFNNQMSLHEETLGINFRSEFALITNLIKSNLDSGEQKIFLLLSNDSSNINIIKHKIQRLYPYQVYASIYLDTDGKRYIINFNDISASDYLSSYNGFLKKYIDQQYAVFLLFDNFYTCIYSFLYKKNEDIFFNINMHIISNYIKRNDEII